MLSSHIRVREVRELISSGSFATYSEHTWTYEDTTAAHSLEHGVCLVAGHSMSMYGSSTLLSRLHCDSCSVFEGADGAGIPTPLAVSAPGRHDSRTTPHVWIDTPVRRTISRPAGVLTHLLDCADSTAVVQGLVQRASGSATSGPSGISEWQTAARWSELGHPTSVSTAQFSASIVAAFDSPKP